jgi:hypothetical protein
MWLDNASVDAIDWFWRQAGGVEPFPRKLEGAVLLALPIAIIKLPRLRTSVIESWLSNRGAPHSFDCDSRSLRGCLVAFGGRGLIFVDGTDPDNERAFTLAHEVAHFLMDYWLCRQKALATCGSQICDVLDGGRPATVGERLHAALSGTPIGVHTDLMDRRASAVGIKEVLNNVENRADRVALALLAPPSAVIARSRISARSFEDRKKAVFQTLVSQFGLPRIVADAYGRSLLTAMQRGPTWSEELR